MLQDNIMMARSSSIGVEAMKAAKSNGEKMPVLFVGHGSPMNIVLENDFTKSLEKIGKELPRPEAIMVVSAHWLTPGNTQVTCMERPRTIYDFYGFPEELYKMKYPSHGSPAHAKAAISSVKDFEVKCDNGWGLDHASWAILRHMYPEAAIPVFEMSLDYSPYNDWRCKPVKYHYDLAAELAELREKGVLIIGSGNIVHNLGLLDYDIDAQTYDWALEFDEKVKSILVDRKHGELINYKGLGRAASMAVPTLDHYLPMIYAIALQEKEEEVKFIHEGFQHGSVSMRCFQIG